MKEPRAVETVQPDLYENTNCSKCHAEWGHYGWCPYINRETAEAWSRLNTPTEDDKVRAHAMGVAL